MLLNESDISHDKLQQRVFKKPSLTALLKRVTESAIKSFCEGL